MSSLECEKFVECEEFRVCMDGKILIAKLAQISRDINRFYFSEFALGKVPEKKKSQFFSKYILLICLFLIFLPIFILLIIFFLIQ